MDILDEEKVRVHDNECQHQFIKKYYENYNAPSYPPSWMIFEIMSFGSVSRVFSGLLFDHRKDIAKQFDVNHRLLSSWLHTLSVLRNICAHHSRLWNQFFGIRPRPDDNNLKEHFEEQRIRSFYAQAVIIKVLLDQTVGSKSWVRNLKKLIIQHPDVPIGKMGFPTDWEDTDIWTTQYSAVLKK